MRQTGTRDIQDRLENVLKQSSVQAITWYGSVGPAGVRAGSRIMAMLMR